MMAVREDALVLQSEYWSLLTIKVRATETWMKVKIERTSLTFFSKTFCPVRGLNKMTTKGHKFIFSLPL
jgi:hypothetical protein